jgi:hypothetical protein
MEDQLSVAQTTLESIRESQRMAQKPMLKMLLHEDPKKGSIAGYVPTEEGGERWQLWNYVYNIGENPAFGLRYFHMLSTDSVIEIPSDSEFVSLWEDDFIFPSEIIICGYDQLLRQIYYDTIKTGKNYYPHFIIQYADVSNNKYAFHAVWQVRYEKEGKPLSFRPVSYQPIEIP